MAIPSAEEQVLFLTKLQRLLSEGQFVASYKFALLLAIADIAVERADESGDPLQVSTAGIAEQFIRLYWRQVRPFAFDGGAENRLLLQNQGRQAAIINALEDAHHRYQGSLTAVQNDSKEWRRLRTKVAQVIRVMPLWKLQRVAGGVDDFIYPQVGKGTSITLRPGAAFCFRRFYGLIRNMIEGAWGSYVRRVNTEVLGQVSDVQEFLFGCERKSLEVFRPLLLDLQQGRCFYCHRSLGAAPPVDHFIPWSRYPVDLGHNFVLSDARCNSSKSDLLASEEHLACWTERNKRFAEQMTDYFRETAIPNDLPATVAIARWAYEQTAAVHGTVWLGAGKVRSLDPTWERLLSQ